MRRFTLFCRSFPFSDGCVDEFEDWSGESEFCYQKSVDAKSWYDAKDFCSTLGGELAVIHTGALMENILDHTRDQSQDTWIGLKKDQLADSNHLVIFIFIEKIHNFIIIPK